MQREEMPGWLAGLDLPEITALERANFPRFDVLTSSVFYPAAHFHGDVIAKLAGKFHSFFYVDYSVDREGFDAALKGFRGYSVAGYKRLTPADLASPAPAPAIDPRFNAEIARAATAPITGTAPFASWAILTRDADHGAAHGPERFGLVYLCADGVAAYHRMYAAERIAPRALAIIQPGHGFGNNYTNFTHPQGLFSHVVLECGAPAPEYLLCGGSGHKTTDLAWWPEDYTEKVAYFSGQNPWSVWRRRSSP